MSNLFHWAADGAALGWRMGGLLWPQDPDDFRREIERGRYETANQWAGCAFSRAALTGGADSSLNREKEWENDMTIKWKSRWSTNLRRLAKYAVKASAPQKPFTAKP